MSNDWIEHTTDTCPVDPETVVEVRYRNGRTETGRAAARHLFGAVILPPAEWRITHYRIITPAKPPEPEMPKPEPDFIAIRLECLKLALQESSGTDHEQVADRFLHYVLNGSVDKA
jgi:hypothetical protein